MGADSTPAPNGATTLSTKETWDAAFAAWEAAKVAYEFADAAYDTARAEADDDEAHNAALDRLATLEDETAQRENETRFGLILTPAPGLDAVSFKMNLLFGREYADLGDDDEYVSSWHRKFTNAVAADVARLQAEFAEAWLAAWTKDGGSVVISDDGQAHYSFPTYDFSPRHVAPADHMEEWFANHFQITNEQHYHSTMNARVDALKMVPGGSGIIKAYMRGKGLRVALPVSAEPA